MNFRPEKKGFGADSDGAEMKREWDIEQDGK